MQKTIVLVKPDALQRGIAGEIITRFERKGLKLVACKMTIMDEEMIRSWYSHLVEKDFFKDIQAFMSSTPILAMVWEGLDVIPAVRKIVGITKSREAEAGSIRGDYGMSQSQNMIHASDSVESAEKEMGLIFNADEIFPYASGRDHLIYDEKDLAN